MVLENMLFIPVAALAPSVDGVTDQQVAQVFSHGPTPIVHNLGSAVSSQNADPNANYARPSGAIARKFKRMQKNKISVKAGYHADSIGTKATSASASIGGIPDPSITKDSINSLYDTKTERQGPALQVSWDLTDWLSVRGYAAAARGKYTADFKQEGVDAVTESSAGAYGLGASVIPLRSSDGRLYGLTSVDFIFGSDKGDVKGVPGTEIQVDWKKLNVKALGGAYITPSWFIEAGPQLTFNREDRSMNTIEDASSRVRLEQKNPLSVYANTELEILKRDKWRFSGFAEGYYGGPEDKGIFAGFILRH